MAVAIKVPSVGESIVEGTIARWFKKDGAAVRANEPLFELETEKATQDIPVPAAGTLRIKSPEGSTVAIGAVVGEIDPAGAPKTETAAPAAEPTRPAPQPAKAEQAPAAIEPALSPSVRRLV